MTFEMGEDDTVAYQVYVPKVQALFEIYALHIPAYEGGCCECKSEYPCRTRKIIDRILKP